MARKPTRKISYSFQVAEPGDVANPALSRASGLTFWVAPPTTTSTAPVGCKNLVTDYGAFPNSSADSSPAVDSWLTYARAQGTSPVCLIIPAGTYYLGGTNALTQGVYDATVYGTGATINNLFIANSGAIVEDYAHSARIASATAGSSTVTLLNSSEADKFTVGNWMMISGLETQGPLEYPPNPQFFEYVQIISKSSTTGVISFTPSLTFDYKSSWPLRDPTSTNSMDLGGPATVYALASFFGGQHTYYGLTNTSTQHTFGGGSRNITLDGMTFAWGPDPSASQNYTLRNCSMVFNEVDKCVSNLTYDNCSVSNQLQIQSASITNMYIVNGSSIATVAGTPNNTTITDSFIHSTAVANGLVLGPQAYGKGNQISITNSSIKQARADIHAVNSTMAEGGTNSGGTFTIGWADAGNWIAMACPGRHYFLGYYDGAIHKVDDGGVTNSFAVSAVSTNGSSQAVITTDLSTSLVPLFGGQRFNIDPAPGGLWVYAAWAAEHISQVNSGPILLSSFGYA